MLKVLPLLILTLLLFDCGSKKRKPADPTPTPTPIFSPTPDSSPSPSPTPSVSPSPSPSPDTPRTEPTPYPTPEIDLAPYLHEQGGQTVIVDLTYAPTPDPTPEPTPDEYAEIRALFAPPDGMALDEPVPLPTPDVAAIINQADQFDGPGKLIIRGGGTIKSQVVLKHDSEWSGTYSLEVETLEGQILLRDNTKVECKDATFLEPTYFSGTPAITVFQTFSSAKNNYAASENVTIKGCRVIGRQEKTDGGVRQTISFGNCRNCAAIENDLMGIASIGIQFGGGAAEGHHAENSLAYRNKLRRFAAAAIALVNVKGAVVAENDLADPGRRKGEPGGISAIDIESNNVDDCVKDIKIFNNRIGYGSGAFQSIGNGILGQNVYKTPCSGGLLIANNLIDGYQGKEGLENSFFWGLSGGLYFVGNWQGGLVVNNVVIRALQPGISLYGVTGLTIQDTWLISSGGGGQGAMYLEGSTGNTFIRVRAFDDPKIKPGSTGWWVTCDETSGVNSYQDVEIAVPEPCKK